MKKKLAFFLLTIFSLTALSTAHPVEALSLDIKGTLNKAHNALKKAHLKAAAFSKEAAAKAGEIGDVVAEKAHKASAVFHEKAANAVAAAKQKVQNFHKQNNTPTDTPVETTTDENAEYTSEDPKDENQA